MASYDRDYQRRMAPQRPKLPPVTKWLLISNLVIFFIDFFQRNNQLPAPFNWGPLNQWGCFSVKSGIFEGRIWELVTFQFLHDSLGHVFFNCLGIYFFGPFVEKWWGSKKFMVYYLLCGVAGGLFFSLLYLIGLLPNTENWVPLVGASAGLFGILFAVYKIAPAARVRLLIPPVELSMKTLALVLAGISVVTILGGLFFPAVGLFWNSGGEAGHLGGAIMGLLLMQFPWLLGKGERPGRKVVRFQQNYESKLRPRSQINPRSATEVDRILDKVSLEGIGSLTEAEKKILEEASKRDS